MFPQWCRRRASDNAWLTAQELSNREAMLVLFCQHRHIGAGKDLGPTLLPPGPSLQPVRPGAVTSQTWRLCLCRWLELGKGGRGATRYENCGVL